MPDTLVALLEQARRVPMTHAEREEQRINFALGNASYENRDVTRDVVVRASQLMRGLDGGRRPEQG